MRRNGAPYRGSVPSCYADVTKGPRRAHRRAEVGGRSQPTERTLLHENSGGQDRQDRERDKTLGASIYLLAHRDQSLCGGHAVSGVLMSVPVHMCDFIVINSMMRDSTCVQVMRLKMTATRAARKGHEDFGEVRYTDEKLNRNINSSSFHRPEPIGEASPQPNHPICANRADS